MFSTRFNLLLFILICAFTRNVQAQCSANMPFSNLSVCAGSDASIPIELSGVAPFVINYQINGVPAPPVTAPTADFELLIPNITQTLSVQLTLVVDGTGCEATGTGGALIQLFPTISATLSTTGVTCATGNDGVIQVNTNGGTPPYTYAWSAGQTTGPVLSGLDVGNYAVTITDANGCTRAYTANLGNMLPSFQYTVTPAACNMSNGAINVTLASPTMFNVWSNGASTEDLVNIPAGTYILISTESVSGCIKQEEIIVPEIPPYVSSTTITPANCSGQGVGAYSVVVAGGTPPYTYLWSNGATTPGITNLFAGTYTVTITDAAGCTASVFGNVTATGNVFLNATVQQPTCNNPDGAINLTVSGGTGPFSYLWSNGATTQDLTGVGTGTYTVTVTEGGGCTNTLSKTLVPYTVGSVASLVNCLNNIDLVITGGTAPYTYEWSNGATTEDLSGVPGGPYTVTVTDALGCIVVQPLSGITIAPQTATISVNTNACSGGLSAQMSGVQPNNTSFLWSTGATTRLLSNIPAGDYSVTTTATISGCTATATFTATQAFSNSFLTLSTIPTQISCFGNNNGAIGLAVTGAFPPFTYNWSNGATTESINNLQQGQYVVTVTDANGCTIARGQNIFQPAVLTATWHVLNPSCSTDVGSVSLVVSGGTAPYAFSWTNGTNIIANTQHLNNITDGTYRVTITDANGCTFVSPDIVVQSPVFLAEIETLSTQCNSATLTVQVTGNAPFQFAWSGPNGFSAFSQNIIVQFSGTYTVIVTNANGCTTQSTIEVYLAGNGPCGYISGKVARDESANCVLDVGEPGLGGWLVRAESAPGTFYGVSNTQGDYWIGVPTGDYSVVTLPPNALWETCLPSPIVTVNMPNDTIEGIDLPVKPVYLCPSLSVSIASGLLRRCMMGTYYVDYCNQGTTDGTDVFVLVTLDPFMTPFFSSLPYVDLGGGVFRFEIGDLEAGACDYFVLNVQVSCDAVLGQTHCTEAHIFPDGNCIPSNSSWSGASLRLTGQCSSDSLRFTIKNIGTGDMPASSDYIVVEDAVMLMRAPFQLPAGDSAIVTLPANGSTWRVEVEQEPFHPGLSAPALSIEACSGTASFSTGFVTQFPNDEQDPWVDIDCKQNVGAFDPNDKQGFPNGYGAEHYIRPGIELEYTIRFQNTGTDTAFTVRIADTLSSWLDAGTIRPGPGSHPYRFNLTGPGYAEFLFENIMLPDSNVNQEGSNGFVKFSIYPRADAPLETLIENTAAIYFDFNAPVITNTTRHRLGENFLMTVGAWQPKRPEYQVLVSPNPFSETARLEVKGLSSSQPVHLQVFDLQGNILHDKTAPGPILDLKKGSLPTGIYLFRLDQKGVLIGSGKLVVRD
ncbi:MAG: hypothetical protein IPL27_16285 [Lewinellaceae bacterium]|nr:hypothetical protein [Lewinellaceae bacterium]